MPALDERFPLNLAERPLHFAYADGDTVALVRSELKRLSLAHREEVDRLLAATAQACFQLARVRGELGAVAREVAVTVIDALEILQGNFEELLAGHGVRLEDLTGQPWVAAHRDQVVIRGHDIRDDVDEPRVAHMELPIVFCRDRLIAKGAAILECPRRDPTREIEPR